ncbi:MFS transporter [Nocardioides sp. BGMRC 2183]|nr:MFS transporter [Nocardioides sp. BGMRC 2183]
MTHSVIDEAPYTGFHRRMLLQSAGGPFLDGYILTIIGVVLGAISTELDLTGTETGMVGAAALIGLFLGGFIFGRLTDIIGRKLMYTLDLAALLVGSVLCLFIQDLWHLLALRLFLGVAVGADYPIATAMLSEWLPRKERGRAMGLLMVWWFTGALAAAVAGFAIVQTAGDDAWRWVLASSALPAAIIMIARHNTPESPRWLVANGHREAARGCIERALGHRCTEAELDVLASGESSGSAYAAIFRPPYLRRTAFVSLFWTFQIIPLFALYTFAGTLLEGFGIEDGAMGELFISGMFLIGLIPAVMLIDRIGRRPLIVWSFAAMTVPFAVLGLAPDAGVVLVFVCFAVYALFSGGPSILEWAYPTELFPTDIRGTAVGFATSFSRIGAAVGTFLLPIALDEFGTGSTMLAMSVVTFLGFLVCLAWAPETKGRSLSDAAGVTARAGEGARATVAV